MSARRPSVAERVAQSAAWPVVQPLYSVGVWAASFTVMGVTALSAIALSPFIPFKRSHRWLGGAGMAACVPITGASLRVSYDPGFDPERRSVFCQNHVNVFDAHVACATIPHAFCGMMLASHFKIPAYGWIMRLADGIPVYPGREGRTAEVSAAARDRIAKGLSILVFPEAHRTRDGQVQSYRRGVFFMARDAGIPVVPLGVRGAYAVNRKGTWRFTPGPVDVYVGPQVETAGLSDAQVSALAKAFEDATATYVRTGVMPTEALQPRWEGADVRG
jgi:1-acyl-sn-glycerol-3-phosphate acyltransferase